MSILPFKKKEAVDINVDLVNTLRRIRTEKKQLAIMEKKIISQMNERKSTDNYLYDESLKPIAKLTISTSTGFDAKLLKEEDPKTYGKYPKLSTRQTWYPL